MRYTVRHATTYRYRAEVTRGRCQLHLLPAAGPRLRVLEAALAIEPAPAERQDGADFFGNPRVQVRFATPATRHRFENRLVVEVKPPALPPAGATPPFEAVRAEALARPELGAPAPAHFLAPSRHVPWLEEARAYAAPSFPPGRPVLAGGLDLMARLHADFTYDGEATEVSTPLATMAAARRGVCQDFAHWMIAGLRALGLPAAYVSGYLRSYPPPGRPRLVGADATHAWAMLWCGGALGWVGLDPTNAIPEGESHIPLARGRDYADVAPVSGVIVASGGHSLSVSVDVAPEGE